MNENIDLTEILEGCPKGTELYSTIYGKVRFERINNNDAYPIEIKVFNKFTNPSVISAYLAKDGRCSSTYDGECTLFPDKDQRDWSKFKPKKPKFDPKTLQVFDKVLARMSNESYNTWYADFVAEPGYTEDETPLTIGAKEANMVIPYNDDTKHLVGTTEEAPEFYRYWEE